MFSAAYFLRRRWQKMIFTDENIENVFGAEDAENESRERLKEYFFRNKAYESLKANLALRVLVGHKGVGKSALLKMASIEDDESSIISIFIRPNDVRGIWDSSEQNLNELIEKWKTGLLRIVHSKVIERLGDVYSKEHEGFVGKSISGLTDAIGAFIRSRSDSVTDLSLKSLMSAFMSNNTIRVYMDDLDRGWEAKLSDIRNLSAMLNAIRDLCGDRRQIQFKIALRTDVYRLLRTSDESTDKIERNIVPLMWDNHEILILMAKRVATYLRTPFPESVGNMKQHAISKFLFPVIDERFQHVGKWENAPIHRVLLSLTRRRPRDLIKIFYGGAKEAYRNGSNRITTTDLRNTFQNYSNERLQDIINEFRFEFTGIKELLYAMKPNRRERNFAAAFQFSRDELSKKIGKLLQQQSFKIAGKPYFSAVDVIEFMYKIDFITARREQEGSEKIIRLHFDDSPHIISSAADFGFHWEIHPAYRWALTPGDTPFVISTTELESTD
jgi:hypothetical protein